MLFINDIQSLPTDISILFAPKKFNEIEIIGYCVYAYLRETADEYGPKGSVYYIGEGTRERPICRNRKVKVPCLDNIYILSNNILNKVIARGQEAILIKHYGRIVNGSGILENISPGSLRSFFEPDKKRSIPFGELTVRPPIDTNCEIICEQFFHDLFDNRFKKRARDGAHKFIDEDWLLG